MRLPDDFINEMNDFFSRHDYVPQEGFYESFDKEPLITRMIGILCILFFGLAAIVSVRFLISEAKIHITIVNYLSLQPTK